MKRLYHITNRTPDGGYYFTEKRGQVFEVGGLSFGCARSFDGRMSTITELSTGMKVADAKKSDAAETVARLLPAIKKAIETEAAQKVAKDLKEYAASVSA